MNVELLITEPLTIKHPSKLGREMLTTCKVKDNSIKKEIIFSSGNVTFLWRNSIGIWGGTPPFVTW